MKHNIYNTINIEAKIIANNYGVSQRLDCLAESNAFISLKYHKSNFSSKSKMSSNKSCKKRNRKINKYFLEKQ